MTDDPLEATLRAELRSREVVHVWRVRVRTLEDSGYEAAALELLSPDERRRADQFRREEPRLRFVECRAALRRLLGMYLERDAKEVRIEPSEFGKPRLASPADAWLSFNLSHSGSYALIAVGRERRVGVDVEQVRLELDHDALARSFFTEEERAELAALPPPARREAFFTCWTRKEAYLKAVGHGLGTPLDSFRVSIGSGEPAALISVRGDAGAAAGWALRDVPVAPGYAGCVAIERPPVEVRHLDYSDAV